MENPPKGYFRLTPDNEVRLKHAYYIRLARVVKDDKTGEIVELHCTYDPETHGGEAMDGRKVKGTIHWVSANHATSAEVRLYDHLFTSENPGDESDGRDFKEKINPDSLVVLKGCQIEKAFAKALPGSRLQFMRHGYFCIDPIDSKQGSLVFNRIVSLKDTWKKK